MGNMSGTMSGASSSSGALTGRNASVKGNVDALFKRGLSAYDLAVASGFEGSLAEWLESLKGEKVELMVDENEILYWKYADQDDWTLLFEIGQMVDREVQAAIGGVAPVILLDEFPETPRQNTLYVIRG